MSLNLPWGPYPLLIEGNDSGDRIGVTSNGLIPPSYTLTIGSNTYDVTNKLNINSGALGHVPINVTIGSNTYNAIDGRLSNGGGNGTIVQDHTKELSNQAWSAGTGLGGEGTGAGGQAY